MEKVYQIWEQGTREKTTQLIFSDLSTPKGDGSYNAYDDIRNKLVQKGVPKEEIAFIHEADTEVKKAALFSKVRSGQVRVLIGSTAKMGPGMNVQNRLIALHHLDVPWKPSDIEQQEGRIIRQGNANEEVKIYRYVTKGTFDAYSWQILENKQKFISQIMTSKSPVRSVDDIDEAALSYAEVKALATGNPYIKEKMSLDIEVAKLRVLKSSYDSQHYRLEDDISLNYPKMIAAARERIAALAEDGVTAEKNLPADAGHFSMTVEGKTYTEKREAGCALMDACKYYNAVRQEGAVGTYAGFSISARYEFFSSDVNLILKGNATHTVSMGMDPLGNITRINNALEGIPDRLGMENDRLKSLEAQLESAKEELAKPFAQAQELRDKEMRLAELNALLNMDSRAGEQEETEDQEAEKQEHSEQEQEEEYSAYGSEKKDRYLMKTAGFAMMGAAVAEQKSYDAIPSGKASLMGRLSEMQDKVQQPGLLPARGPVPEKQERDRMAL